MAPYNHYPWDDTDLLTDDYILHLDDLRPANPDTLPVFPPEIIDHIISFLWDHPRSLRNCVLTCRAWRPASQKNMFHSITLCSHSQFESFVRQVLHDPHRKECLRLVHHLTVRDMHHSRPFLHAIPHHIAGYLTQLKTITFGFSEEFAPHPSFYAALHGFTSVHGLSLRQFAFNRLRDLTMLISAFPHLDELDIGTMRYCYKAIVPEGSRGPGPQLKVLHFSAQLMYLNALCAWLCRTRSSTSITHLHIHSLGDLDADSSGVQQLISSLGGSLIHLDTSCFKFFAEVPTLAHNINLQFLRLRASYGFETVDWMTVARIMSQVVSRLRRLEIECVLFTRSYEEGPERWNRMAAIDADLCRENFGDLEQVKLDLSFSLPGSEENETECDLGVLRDCVVRDIRQCLPRIHARGILSIDVHWHEPF